MGDSTVNRWSDMYAIFIHTADIWKHIIKITKVGDSLNIIMYLFLHAKQNASRILAIVEVSVRLFVHTAVFYQNGAS